MKAFTLSEVLITIGIIGVVAALTIPFLITKINNKELVSSFLKSHAVLSNAFKEMEVIEGLKLTDMNMDIESDNYFPTLFENHLRKNPDCETGKVCLTDGSTFEYQNPNFATSCTESEPCVELLLDVNGKKGPNKPGKDQYTLLVTRNGIKAKGSDIECTGLDCGKYVLAHHKLWGGEPETTNNNNEIASVTCSEETRACGVFNVCSNGTVTQISTTSCTTAERKAATTEVLASCDSTNETECTIKDANGNDLVMTKEGTAGKEKWVSPTLKAGDWEPVESDITNNDYWQGAKEYCESQGLTLPTREQLYDLHASRGCAGIIATDENGCYGKFWSSEVGSQSGAYRVSLSCTPPKSCMTNTYRGESSLRALCVAN